MESVTSDSIVVTEPMDATVAMKRSGVLSGMIVEETVAPTVEVIPGNHPAIVPIITPF